VGIKPHGVRLAAIHTGGVREHMASDDHFSINIMKALAWHGTGDVRVDTVPDPHILDPRDIIIKITASGICGSDLHLYNGMMPSMEEGDIIGHEPMGIGVGIGSSVKNSKKVTGLSFRSSLLAANASSARNSLLI